MIYITGDKHGSYDQVEEFCHKQHTSLSDILIVLGDNGVNYSGDRRDQQLKNHLSKLPITFFFIRGNHDQRPTKEAYHEKKIRKTDYAGRFLIEDKYPSLLFAIDGEFYTFGMNTALVLGGAYSIDKHFRLEQQKLGNTQWKWFADEQLSLSEKKSIETRIETEKSPTFILTHTCPLRYALPSNIVPICKKYAPDQSMEKWFDKLEKQLSYKKWFCGHWHQDTQVDKIRFMYNDIIEMK